MFTAACSTIAEMWKRPRCPSTDKWRRRGYAYAREHDSAMKKKASLPFGWDYRALVE